MAMALVVPQRLVHLSLVDSIIIVSTLRWCWPSASTVAVSLLTAPRPESELRGLVYGATEIPSEQEVAFYLRPAFWAVVVAVVFVVHVLVRDNACRGIDFDLVFHWNFAVRKRPADPGSDLLLHFRLGR